MLTFTALVEVCKGADIDYECFTVSGDTLLDAKIAVRSYMEGIPYRLESLLETIASFQARTCH